MTWSRQAKKLVCWACSLYIMLQSGNSAELLQIEILLKTLGYNGIRQQVIRNLKAIMKIVLTPYAKVQLYVQRENMVM
jgi:hypothetical protein